MLNFLNLKSFFRHLFFWVASCLSMVCFEIRIPMKKTKIFMEFFYISFRTKLFKFWKKTIGDFRIFHIVLMQNLPSEQYEKLQLQFHNKKEGSDKRALVSFSNLFYLTGFIYVKQYRMSMDIKYIHLVTKEVNLMF